VPLLSGGYLLRDFSYEFAKNERIGVVGPNGAGKTTLLKALQQQLPLEEGRIIQGETVRLGYYSQEGLPTSDHRRVLDFVREAVSEACPEGGAVAHSSKATELLRQFLFPSARWSETVGRLSGGERRRLQLLQVLALEPNLLLLDEPTNDWDIDSMAILEDFLSDFAGVLVLVSHDRWFVDRACDRLFVLPGDSSGELKVWDGRFTDYLAWRDAVDVAAAEAEAAKAAKAEAAKAAEVGAEAGSSDAQVRGEAAEAKKARPLSKFELASLERLEAELEEYAEAKAKLQRDIDSFDPSRNGYQELDAWVQQLANLAATIETTEERWLSLAERA